jgi:L-seryl-tRNA(Ser) seleniumtransferase
MNVELLRQIPSVDLVLALEGLEYLPRPLALRATRRVLDELRTAVKSGELDFLPDIVEAVQAEAARLGACRIRRVINATGIVLHTNLGRAPLAPSAADAVAQVAGGYSNVELDLTTGKRGGRLEGVRECLKLLVGCEDAVVVNNNAAAVLLMLSAHAKGREVVVSRGELVEIGGSFRIPDVMALSGAKLVEVGSTNRTRCEDYAQAICESTAVLLRVHPSNFRMEGFTERPDREGLAALGVPFFEDLGSGALLPMDGEPDIAHALRAGATLVSFSGDKLLGGSQAGLIVGSAAAVAACRAHPLYRALRLDKLALAALEATLRLYVQGRTEEIPAVSMVGQQSAGDQAAVVLKDLLNQALPKLVVHLEEDVGFSGGGALPGKELSGHVLRIVCKSPDSIAAKLRTQRPAILARVARGGLVIDPRCVLCGEETALIAGLCLAFQSPTGEE